MAAMAAFTFSSCEDVPEPYTQPTKPDAGGTTEGELCCGLGQGGVEVEGVGEVELAGDQAGAGPGDLLVVDVEPT